MGMLSLLAVQPNVTFYIFPLAVVISLVYSATRFELAEPILRRAARLFMTMLIFMSVVLAVLVLLSRNL